MFPLGFSCLVVLFCACYRRFRLRDCYLLWWTFPGPSTNYFRFLHGWALSRSLAATYDIDVSFFSSSYLDVSVRWVRFSYTIYSCKDSACAVGCPIRRSTGYWLLAPYRSFSQLVTSFFASWCLGIRLVLLLT